MKRCGCVLGVLAIVSLWAAAAWAAEQNEAPQLVSQIEPRANAVVDLWPVDPAPLKPQIEQEINEYRVNRKTGELDRAIWYVNHPTISVYLPEHPDQARPGIVICPGGGYRGVMIDREGYNIADRMNKLGIAAFILKYRLPIGVTPGADQLPSPVQDVQRAIRLVRSEAEKWNIDPNRLGVIGFSAGGSLAGLASTLYDERDVSVNDPLADVSCRPDFAVLVYPVASMHADAAHMGSRNNLIGEGASVQVEDRFSTAQRITPDTPPLFLVHARDDKVVPIANSEQIAAAAEEAGVAHVFVQLDIGGHGFALGSPDNGTDVWVARLVTWLKEGGFLQPDPRRPVIPLHP
ncbi:MAG: alpha/beta hydrolase [Phycisphaeraceae bacterium]|nr:alpha/beta hydrolase [Phycisphaeraceae bacterium]